MTSYYINSLIGIYNLKSNQNIVMFSEYNQTKFYKRKHRSSHIIKHPHNVDRNIIKQI